MVEAKIHYYFTSTLYIGGWSADKEVSNPGRAIYVESRALLIRIEASSSFVIAPSEIPIYPSANVITGDEAHKQYKEISDILKTNPVKREVSEELIEWANALKRANNPPKELSDILMKK